jgi:hypothetical protein
MFSLHRLLKFGYVLVLGSVVLVLSLPAPVGAQRALMAPFVPPPPPMPIVGGFSQSVAQTQAMLALAAFPKSPTGGGLSGTFAAATMFPGLGTGGFGAFGQAGGFGLTGGLGLGGGFNGFGLGGFNGFGLGGGGLGGGFGLGGFNGFGLGGGFNGVGVGGFAGKGFGGFNGKKAL